MNLKIIGGVDYCEVKDLIKRLHQNPKIENRGRIFRKQLYNVYFSSDKKYALAFKYKGDFHWGPMVYNLTLETRENNKTVLKKDFGSRIFIRDHYRKDYPWAKFCNKFYLLEMEEKPDNKTSNFIKIYDVDNDIEMPVADNGLSILACSKNLTHIIYNIYHKDNTIDVAVTDLSNRRTINIIKESRYYLYTAFFDKDEKYIITIEQNKENNDLLLKVFTLSDVNLIYSQKIDLKHWLPEKSLFGIFIKKNTLFRTDTSWFTVEFCNDTNALYFGMPKKGSLWGPDYYERLLWLKAELEF